MCRSDPAPRRPHLSNTRRTDKPRRWQVRHSPGQSSDRGPLACCECDRGWDRCLVRDRRRRASCGLTKGWSGSHFPIYLPFGRSTTSQRSDCLCRRNGSIFSEVTRSTHRRNLVPSGSEWRIALEHCTRMDVL